MAVAALLPHLGWAAQPWVAEGPTPLSGAGSYSAGILSPTTTGTELQLTQTDCNSNWPTQAVCGTWLYNCLTTTCFLWAYASAPNSTTSTGQGDIPISSTRWTCFFRLITQVHRLIDGSVEDQYVTQGDRKAPFSIATTPRCRGGRYSFTWIAPLYLWYIPYIAEC